MSDKSISHAISGGLSGLVSMAVTYPLVTLSTNAQAKTTKEFEETAKEEEIEEDKLLEREEEQEEKEEEEEEEEEDLHSDKSSITKLTFRTIPHEISQEFDNSITKDNIENDKHNSKKKNLKIKLIRLFKKLILRFKFLIQHSTKFYSGLESALIGIVSVNFVYYYVYNLTGNYFKKLNLKKGLNSTGLNVKDSLLTGLIAGIISRIITNPIWVANTRMTVKQKIKESNENNNDDNEKIDVSKQNTFKVIYEIFKNEGLNGLFSGLTPALILVLSPMIQFTIFEQLKNILIKFKRNKQNKQNINSIEALLLGSFGKLIAILITYPYYTIRSRMHLNKDKEDKINNLNSFKLLFSIIKNEGINSLYNGLNAKLLQSVISAGLIFYFKEEMMSIVGLIVNIFNERSNLIINNFKNIKKIRK